MDYQLRQATPEDAVAASLSYLAHDVSYRHLLSPEFFRGRRASIPEWVERRRPHLTVADRGLLPWTATTTFWDCRTTLRSGSEARQEESRAKSFDAMRVFRDGAFRESPGRGAWWAEFAAASSALAMVAEQRPDVHEALNGLVQDAATWLGDGAERIGGQSLERLNTVLDALAADSLSHGARTLDVIRQSATKVPFAPASIQSVSAARSASERMTADSAPSAQATLVCSSRVPGAQGTGQHLALNRSGTP